MRKERRRACGEAMGRSEKRREEEMNQKRLDEKHDTKGDTTDQINLAGFAAGRAAGENVQNKPGNQPAKKGAKEIGHQIVDIRGAGGEHLQQFDEQGGTQTEEKGGKKSLETHPVQGQEQAEGNKQKYIQKIGGIGKHIGKGLQIKIWPKAGIGNGGKSGNGKDGAEIKRQDPIPEGFGCILEQMPI